jgi:pyruvate kinase
VIATIGPACDRHEILVQMIQAGMNVARLNFSHGTPEEHRDRVERIRRASDQTGAHVAIMVDTKGLEIRAGKLTGGQVDLIPGESFTLYADSRLGDTSGVSVTYRGLGEEVRPGHRVLLDDGALELIVVAMDAEGVRCRVERGGLLRDRKGIHLPDTELSHADQGPRDHADLIFAAENDADYIAASFMQNAADVERIRSFVEGRGADIPIIAKIESHSAVEHLEEIVEAANGTMVARGDLGVELSMAEVPAAQKKIIRTTVTAGKPVITATQMLDSMERNPRPTRAEVSDVANAILDGTSAVMLSGETAVGQYPVEAVHTMAALAYRAESSLAEYGFLQKIRPNPSHVVTEAVSQAAITMANAIEAAAIVALTESGFTARMISKYRPECPIVAVTASRDVERKLSMNWGVIAVRCRQDDDDEERVQFAIRRAREMGFAEAGDVVVTTAGRSRKSGGTDLIRVETVT